MRFLLLLFIVFPIIELWLLFKLAAAIGATATVAEVLLSGVLGVALMRLQSPRTLMRGRERLDAGELPAQELFEAMILALSGVLLLVPGVISDGVGIWGLLPWTRRWLARRLAQNARVTGVYMHGFQRRRQADHTFEGEYWHEQDGARHHRQLDRDDAPSDRDRDA